MTIKNETSKDVNSADDKADSDSEKNKQESNASVKTKSEKKSGFFSPMLITILLALSLAIIISYMYMPEKFNEYLSFNSTEKSASEDETSKDAANQDYIPVASAEDYAMNNQPQQADWAAQQRADFEKRRAEFQKRNEDHYAQQRQPTAPPEPPQWFKDRQVEMEKQRAEYMRAMSEQQARWENNRLNQMRMNPYQQNAANNQPYYAQQPAMQYPQNQPYNPYNQPPQQQQYYYPAPAHNYGPYNAPYGWQGNGYR